MASEGQKTGNSRRRVLEGANLIVYTLIALAIVVVVNYFVSRHDTRWDLTPNKNFSLSAQTVKILKGLKQDVTIYVFDRKENMQTQADLLDNYSTVSNRVTVRYVDPNRDPVLAREFSIHRYGSVIVASGDLHFEAKDDTEQGITNALIHVLEGEKTVYFIQGHGERDLDGTDDSGYQKIKGEFANASYTVKPLVLMQKLQIPADAAMLIIAGPHTDYLPPEVDAIEKYVSSGGRALIMLDPGVELPNLDKMLADWNVTVQSDLVIDENPVAQIFGTRPEMPLIIKYGNSVIVKPLERTATLFPMTRSFVLSKDYKAGVATDSLCETSAESFGVAGFNSSMVKIAYRPDKDFKGPLTVAASIELTPSEMGVKTSDASKNVNGRVVALGTSALASNAYLGFQGNRDLVMNIVSWLSSEENLISIRPKPPAEQVLNVSSRQMSQVFMGVIGLPLIIIVIGTLVWWRRR